MAQFEASVVPGQCSLKPDSYQCMPSGMPPRAGRVCRL